MRFILPVVAGLTQLCLTGGASAQAPAAVAAHSLEEGISYQPDEVIEDSE